MKKLFKGICMMLVLMIALVVPAFAEGVQEVTKDNFFMDLLLENIEAIGVVVTWLVLRLAPTKWKDPILSLLSWIISIIPDKKSGGGKHEKHS